MEAFIAAVPLTRTSCAVHRLLFSAVVCPYGAPVSKGYLAPLSLFTAVLRIPFLPLFSIFQFSLLFLIISIFPSLLLVPLATSNQTPTAQPVYPVTPVDSRLDLPRPCVKTAVPVHSRADLTRAPVIYVMRASLITRVPKLDVRSAIQVRFYLALIFVFVLVSECLYCLHYL
jgi:hypothetical protein